METGRRASPSVSATTPGAIRLASGALRASRDGVLVGEAPANAPIDIEVEGWKPGALKSKGWDGRNVSLHIDEVEAGKRNPYMRPCWWTIRAPCRRGAKATRGITFPSMKRSGMDCAPSPKNFGRRTDISLWEFDHTCDPVDREPCGFARKVLASDRKAYAALRRHGDRRRHRPRLSQKPTRATCFS